MTLADHFQSTIAALRLPPGRAIVAVSGGVDSLVLLELLARTNELHRQELLIAHVDHGLQPVTEPRAIVERAAARLALPLRIIQLHLPLDSTETEAREARLGALRDLAGIEHCGQIFLAHHADDQAETVLMRAMRGSGPAGLRGITRRRGIFLRPLLSCRRAELVTFAVDERMTWWEDPANRDPKHLRSWLRAEIMPLVEQQLPDLTPRLLQLASHARRERRAWSQLLSTWPGLGWTTEGHVQSLAIATLREMPAALREAVLGAMAREAGCPGGPARLRFAWQSIASAGSGQRADLDSGWKFEIAFDRLRLLPPLPDGTTPAASINSGTGSLDWGTWRLAWSTECAPLQQERASATAWFVPAELQVRAWRAGDRVMPLGGTGHRLAVRCFQDAKVPSSARAAWPIIEHGGRVAWIPGVCRSDQLLPPAGTPSLRIEVSPRV